MQSLSRNIAIIPARGGSKRIPEKKYKKVLMAGQSLHIQYKPLLNLICLVK